jgi:hypothetical protein
LAYHQQLREQSRALREEAKIIVTESKEAMARSRQPAEAIKQQRKNRKLKTTA